MLMRMRRPAGTSHTRLWAISLFDLLRFPQDYFAGIIPLDHCPWVSAAVRRSLISSRVGF